jgi:integrase
MEALGVEECRRLLTVARESEWYALFALALTTGMRPSEYLALKWSDIDWHLGVASVVRRMDLLRYKAQAESPGCEIPEFRS